MGVYRQTTISLNEKDVIALDLLKKRGFTIIDIFRAGLNDLEARKPKRVNMREIL